MPSTSTSSANVATYFLWAVSVLVSAAVIGLPYLPADVLDIYQTQALVVANSVVGVTIIGCLVAITRTLVRWAEDGLLSFTVALSGVLTVLLAGLVSAVVVVAVVRVGTFPTLHPAPAPVPYPGYTQEPDAITP